MLHSTTDFNSSGAHAIFYWPDAQCEHVYANFSFKPSPPATPPPLNCCTYEAKMHTFESAVCGLPGGPAAHQAESRARWRYVSTLRKCTIDAAASAQFSHDTFAHVVRPRSPRWFRKQQQVWGAQRHGPERVLRRRGERLPESAVLRPHALLHHPRPGQLRARDHHRHQAA